MKLGGIKQYRMDYTKILNSPARKMERLFNCITGHIRDITGRPTEQFKKQLDEWLKWVPDQSKCGAYAGRAGGKVTLQMCNVQCTILGGEPLRTSYPFETFFLLLGVPIWVFASFFQSTKKASFKKKKFVKMSKFAPFLI